MRSAVAKKLQFSIFASIPNVEISATGLENGGRGLRRWFSPFLEGNFYPPNEKKGEKERKSKKISANKYVSEKRGKSWQY